MEQNQPAKKNIFSKPWMQSLTGIVGVVVILVGVLVIKSISSRVSIEDSLVSAPVIAIGPQSEGILQEVDVKAGDTVTAGEQVARVGSEVLTAQIGGLVIDVQDTPGQVFQPGTAVVSMIDPTQLRIVGTIEEDKGLSRIKVGDTATFTVDAFSGKKFTGVVDSVSPTSDQSGVLFNISDDRAVQKFDVKVAYDVAAHPEFRNGMSAKLKIYTK